MIRPWSSSSPRSSERSSAGRSALEAGQRRRVAVRRKPLARGHRWPAGSTGRRRTGRAAGRRRRRPGRRLVNARARPAVSRTTKHLLGLRLLDLLARAARADHRRLGEREDLDHDPLVVGVPGQRHRAGPELLLDRLLERVGVRRGRPARRPGSVSSPSVGAHQLVEQLVDALGEHRHLLLLEGDAGDPGAVAGLEEEGALPGRADGAGDEALGRVEAVDHRRHGTNLEAASTATDARPCGRS